jgi:hypothetical protein
MWARTFIDQRDTVVRARTAGAGTRAVAASAA